MKLFIKTTSLFFIIFINTLAQFGMNRVQYKSFDWYYIQTKHFDVYFTGEGKYIAEFTAHAAEASLDNIQSILDYQINNRIAVVVYNSHNDFQETNTTDSYLSQGTGGFTEPFKNRVVFPFEGSYDKFEHVIHHELVHAVMRDQLYGGTVQNIIAKGITLQLPHWYWEGMAEYVSSGWETNSDQFIRNAIINEFLPDINQLSGYYGYRGGQAVFKYIADKYGKQKVGDLLNKVKGSGSVEDGFKSAVGLSIEELSERWKKDLKVTYWPEIAFREEPDDFAERVTENKKSYGFYNISPSISPMGDKVAFISDRDIYLDVYVMDLKDKENIKRVATSGKTNDFEELNILFPTITWSPDNKHIALSVKSSGFDVIKIINTETEGSYDLPFNMNGIESVSWSANGEYIAFAGADAKQSDIYIYNFSDEKLNNVTNDIFSDFDPAWAPDNRTIYFSSDRGKFIDNSDRPEDFVMYNHDYNQIDIYSITYPEEKITRITDWPYSNEKSVVISPDGSEIIFTSDKNGISNIYKKLISQLLEDSSTAIPITNSLNEISQLSLSADGKKLLFASLFKAGYNIFLINNPFDKPLEKDELELTKFMKSFIEGDKKDIDAETLVFLNSKTDSVININAMQSDEKADTVNEQKNRLIFTGEFVDESANSDSTKMDYSNYIFGGDNISIDSTYLAERREEVFNEKLDKNGNYLVNNYKISFSPDLIYANAGWSTLYGLLGTTVLSFSDVLGNHRLIGLTSLQIDLKNSDYGLAYYYLGSRLNFGIEGFHTARFVYLTRNYRYELYRFRNFGGVLSTSYPLSRFYRLDGGLSVMSVTSENLDNINESMENNLYVIPSLSFVRDNSMWGYYSPIQGERYNITLFGNPGIGKSRQSFYSVVWDYRNYFRFWFDNSFAFRISGGFSGGANPQRFFLGGTENWINRTFATGEIPLESASDFAFLTPALPMRGYDYAEQIGTKYSLINLELRMPLIRYLLTGPLPLFFQNILGTMFIDIGTAWENNNKLQLFTRDEIGNRITKDLLIGTGFGTRFYFLFFLLRFDVAWAYNIESFSKPKYYFSIGTDF